MAIITRFIVKPLNIDLKMRRKKSRRISMNYKISRGGIRL